MSPDSSHSAEEARKILLSAGLHRAGFARAARAPGAERLALWIERGFAGTMAYMSRSAERRQDPRLVLEGARTVISVALQYGGPRTTPREVSGSPRISRYAQGTDYHRVMERRLRSACTALAEAFPGDYRYHVDTGHILERDWAQACGIGWIGKNACAIHPALGSYFFLGAVLTTAEFPPDPPSTNRCGTCRRCLDACPTGALVAPYELDARRCISYLTIEHRGALPAELEPRAGDWIFGCDVCQDVCPYNRRGADREAAGAVDPELAPREENLHLSLRDLSLLDPEAFRLRFKRSAVLRAKAEGFLRNLMVFASNSRSPEAREALSYLSTRKDVLENPVLAETLLRALQRLGLAAGRSPDGALR